jgi:ATP-dependent DNA helicase RecG
MTDQELEKLLADLESDRVERTISTTNTDKFGEAICAFANDMPNSRLPGVLFIGANDDGSCGNIQITDQLLQNLGGIRSDGNVIPTPAIVVEKRRLNNCDLAVVVVQPSYDTPVRFRGRVWIRVGPRRAVASRDEERRLTEKRRSHDIPFDLMPVRSATIDDLDLDLFLKLYLPSAVAPEILERNNRTTEEQLLSLRFLFRDGATRQVFPTITGLIAVGKEPRNHLSGSYVQFIRFAGRELTDPIKDSKEVGGSLPDLMRGLDEIFKAHTNIETDFRSGTVEKQRPDYPLVALQQIARNAILHRNYEGSNAPVRINWFEDRIEILSPGGPFGLVSIENFGQPGITDYRNAHIAEAMKVLGYVQRFGVGIATAKNALKMNGNPDMNFTVTPNYVLAVIKRI